MYIILYFACLQDSAPDSSMPDMAFLIDVAVTGASTLGTRHTEVIISTFLHSPFTLDFIFIHF